MSKLVSWIQITMIAQLNLMMIFCPSKCCFVLILSKFLPKWLAKRHRLDRLSMDPKRSRPLTVSASHDEVSSCGPGSFCWGDGRPHVMLVLPVVYAIFSVYHILNWFAKHLIGFDIRCIFVSIERNSFKHDHRAWEEFSDSFGGSLETKCRHDWLTNLRTLVFHSLWQRFWNVLKLFITYFIVENASIYLGKMYRKKIIIRQLSKKFESAYA